MNQNFIYKISFLTIFITNKKIIFLAIAIPLSFEAILKQQRLAFPTHRECVNIHDQQTNSFILQENEGSHNFSTSPNR